MYRILVVDDEPLIRDGLRRIIDWEEHGIEIVGEASNGEEALEAIRKFNPDILLTDIKMPVMNGLQLIRTAREKHFNIKTIVISGFDDFQFVKEALKYGVENYILKPISREELSSTLLNTVEKIQSELYAKIKSRENEFVIRDNILYRLVTNRISQKELQEKSSLLNINTEANSFMTSIVKILNAGNAATDDSVKDDSLLGFSVINILGEIISEGFKCSIFRDLDGNMVIIFHDSSLNKNLQTVEELLRKCIFNIDRYLKINVFITTGNIQERLEDVHMSYDAARDLMQYFLIYPPNSIVSYEKVKQEHKKRQEICDIDLDKLADLILTSKKSDISGFFDEIHARLLKETGVTYEYIHALTIEILSCYMNIMKSNGLEINEVLNSYEGLFCDLLKQKTIDGILTSMKHISLEISDNISLQKARPKTLIEQIIEYINTDYHRYDLSLKILSAQFNITTPYLGQLLKKKTGELFSDYLNGIRIDKAKILLTNTCFKANEISEKVGYADPNYFYRIFKKSAGVYPSEYRDTNGQ